MLMKELIREAKQKKCKNIRLGVLTKNKIAQKIYHKLGFKTTHYEMKKTLGRKN